MNTARHGQKPAVSGFRLKLFGAMMLIVAALTALGLFIGQRKIAGDVERDLQEKFQSELTALHKLQGLRDATLAERCRALSDKPRIHAALEDNALDLLYVSAKDELRNLMEPGGSNGGAQPVTSLHATFYRFLDANGAVLLPPNPKDVGELPLGVEAQLSLQKLPDKQQVGYIAAGTDTAFEIVAVPIFSTETDEVISALVVGFNPFEPAGRGTPTGMKSGIWTDGLLYFPLVSRSAQLTLASEISKSVAKNTSSRNNFIVRVDGIPHLLFYKRLNPDSIFRPAYEISIYPIASSIAELHRLRWNIGSAAAVLLLSGFVFSRFAVARLSKPVEQLAVDSEQDRSERERAEAALESATEELERSTRYSADASHQLKSPVTMLRVGLENLLNCEDFKPEVYEELSNLLHQTHRLTGVIDDLLLLARMDTGHLQIKLEPVNISQVIEEWLDDLSALPDAPEIKIEKEIPPQCYVAGERQYISLIVQNLLENARKYNRPSGRMRVALRKENSAFALGIGNTGKPIPLPDQSHIFERFHRDCSGSSVAGHGLGLNLARELTRLQGGVLRLVRSGGDWTEFQVRFQVANPGPGQER